MTPRQHVRLILKTHGVCDLHLRPAHENPLLRLAWWTRGAWVTVGSTIHYPEGVTNILAHQSMLAHEYEHVLQWRTWGPLMWLVYVIGFPLPVFFAVGRAMIECTAYAAEVVHYERSEDECAKLVASSLYGWSCPLWLTRKLMRRAVVKCSLSGLR